MQNRWLTNNTARNRIRQIRWFSCFLEFSKRMTWNEPPKRNHAKPSFHDFFIFGTTPPTGLAILFKACLCNDCKSVVSPRVDTLLVYLIIFNKNKIACDITEPSCEVLRWAAVIDLVCDVQGREVFTELSCDAQGRAAATEPSCYVPGRKGMM